MRPTTFEVRIESGKPSPVTGEPENLIFQERNLSPDQVREMAAILNEHAGELNAIMRITGYKYGTLRISLMAGGDASC